MRLTVLQLETTWADRAGVLARVDALLAAGGPTDLVLLPEAALTGYVSPELDFDLQRFAESQAGATAHDLAALAIRHRTTLVGSLVLRRDDLMYNAMTAYGPTGEHVFTYEKRHPWIPETWATAGRAPPPVVRVADADVTIAICFDLQFVDADPTDALEAADVLLFPSAWVDDDGTRIPLLQGLARRFGLWIGNANWAAGYVEVPGQGESCLLDPSGRVVERLAQGDGRIDVTVAPRPREPG